MLSSDKDVVNIHHVPFSVVPENNCRTGPILRFFLVALVS